eukprot:jgi/Botrbrau1/4556/Bobra.60_2s0043.1
MGYAGYVSAKLPPPKPTEIQAALWSITSIETLELIVKLIQNIAINPGEQKFKRIKLSNPKIKSGLVDVPGGLEALLALGWIYDEEDKESLVVPKGRQLTMTEVRQVQDAQDRLKKELKLTARNAMAAKVKAATTAEIRSQLEADRRERATAEPITLGSKAQTLPSGQGINTCKDAGIHEQ